jgi:predicted hotdog family 3-hydroxylacyl-ACP dehydratase
MNPQEFDIHDLIPQRPPMSMITELVYADERSAIGRLVIGESNIFCKSGHLGESGLIEFIAQTAAAYTGYRNKINNAGVTEGYIGAIKSLVISELPPVNAEIKSEIVLENEIVGFTIVSGKIYFEDRIIAACEMRILGKQ